MPITKEGLPFIAFPSLLSIILFYFSKITFGIIFLLLALFMAYFFRDPKREILYKENQVLSPADGKIIEMEEKEDEIFPKEKLFKVSIFMSPLNVHINRAPMNGKVERIIYRPGTFKPAYKKDSNRNEQNIILIETKNGQVMMKQIAGVLARRVVCKIRENQELKAGEKIGMIIFGSRVELFFKKRPSLLVREGDKVSAGKTVIGEFHD